MKRLITLPQIDDIIQKSEWNGIFSELRMLLLDAGLTETLKWNQPCYTYSGKNVVILAAFKDRCALSFIKGALLTDDTHLLKSPGVNSRSVRYLEFKNQHQLQVQIPIIKQFITEAKEIEKSGKFIPRAALSTEDFPKELLNKIKASPEFKTPLFH